MVDYHLEWLQTLFSEAGSKAYPKWQEAFDHAVKNWQFDQAQLLLRLVKSHPLDQPALGNVRFAEGVMWEKWGDWETARGLFEQALDIKRSLSDLRGQQMILNALANLDRRRNRPLKEVILLYENALQIAKDLQDEAAQVGVLNGLGLAYYVQGQHEEARQHFQKVLAYAQRNNQNGLAVTSLHNLGSIAWTQGKLEEAEKFFTQAMQLQQSQGDRHGEAETLNSLGLIQEAWGDWQLAKSLYTQALSAMQTTGDVYGQVQTLVNLGNVAWLLQDHDAALSFYQQGQAIVADLGDVKLEAQILSGLGDTYRSMGKYVDAEHSLLQAIDLKKQSGDLRSLKHTFMGLGALYHNLHRPQEAQKYYEHTLESARSQGDTRIESLTLYNLAALQMAQQQFSGCEHYLNQAMKIATQHDYRDCLAQVYEQFGDLELMKPEPDSAKILEHYGQALAYASDFNQLLLERILNHLLAFWVANAEDGDVEGSIWFCDSMIELWNQSGLAKQNPLVTEAFQNLKIKLVSA